MRKSYSEKMFPQTEMKGKQEPKESIAMKMRRSISEKAMAKKKKMNEGRFLIDINVFGSAGPLRFVVKEDDTAAAVVETTLKIYAREGRLPLLGSNADAFFLYPSHAGFEALNPLEKIGSRGARSFVLSKKEGKPHMTEEIIDGKRKRWRAWLQKSLSLKIISP